MELYGADRLSRIGPSLSDPTYPSKGYFNERISDIVVNWSMPGYGGFGPGLDRSTIFAATDHRVLISRSLGYSWYDFSEGLPRTPHCVGLRILWPGVGSYLLMVDLYGLLRYHPMNLEVVVVVEAGGGIDWPPPPRPRPVVT